jgi:hypothetical protein
LLTIHQPSSTSYLTVHLAAISEALNYDTVSRLLIEAAESFLTTEPLDHLTPCSTTSACLRRERNSIPVSGQIEDGEQKTCSAMGDALEGDVACARY